jgi:hypothetical protein
MIGGGQPYALLSPYSDLEFKLPDGGLPPFWQAFVTARLNEGPPAKFRLSSLHEGIVIDEAMAKRSGITLSRIEFLRPRFSYLTNVRSRAGVAELRIGDLKLANVPVESRKLQLPFGEIGLYALQMFRIEIDPWNSHFNLKTFDKAPGAEPTDAAKHRPDVGYLRTGRVGPVWITPAKFSKRPALTTIDFSAPPGAFSEEFAKQLSVPAIPSSVRLLPNPIEVEFEALGFAGTVTPYAIPRTTGYSDWTGIHLQAALGWGVLNRALVEFNYRDNLIRLTPRK